MIWQRPPCYLADIVKAAFSGMLDQVALDIEYHHSMLISHQKVNLKEVIVGFQVKSNCTLFLLICPQLLFVLKEPICIVAVITPWNYPLLIATWKVAPALAASCAAILKPSELAYVYVLIKYCCNILLLFCILTLNFCNL